MPRKTIFTNTSDAESFSVQWSTRLTDYCLKNKRGTTALVFGFKTGYGSWIYRTVREPSKFMTGAPNVFSEFLPVAEAFVRSERVRPAKKQRHSKFDDTDALFPTLQSFQDYYMGK